MHATTCRAAMIGIALTAACLAAPKPESVAPAPTLVELRHPRQLPDTLLSPDSVVPRTGRAADSMERARHAMLDRQSRSVAERQVRLADLIVLNRASILAAEKSAELREELTAMVRFDVASAEVRPAARLVLDRKVVILAANPAVQLRLVGLSDERGTVRENLALGERRARAVKHYLIQNGIDSVRLHLTSSGEATPLDSGRSEAAWARNRRVEFVIVAGDSLSALR